MSEPMPEQPGEPLAQCVTCHVLRSQGKPHDQRDGRVCARCKEKTLENLAAIPAAYGDLDPTPVRGETQIRSRAFESKPPLNINELSLQGPGRGTPQALLEFWCTDWADLRQETHPPAAVSTMAGWLLARLDWACDDHAHIDDFAADMREVAGALHVHARAAERRGYPCGTCPRVFRDDMCGTPLFVDPYADRIECSRCGTSWSRKPDPKDKRKGNGWLHLRAQQLAAGVDMLDDEGEAAA